MGLSTCTARIKIQSQFCCSLFKKHVHECNGGLVGDGGGAGVGEWGWGGAVGVVGGEWGVGGLSMEFLYQTRDLLVTMDHQDSL